MFSFRQKTPYEMRISDWSSDVCSYDHTRLREAEIFDIRRATRRDEKALRDDGFGNPVAQHRKRRVPFRRLADGLIGEFPKDGDALARKIVGQRGADLGFHFGQKATAENERYLDTAIGRASCRERGCQYVKISVVAESLKKKRKQKT